MAMAGIKASFENYYDMDGQRKHDISQFEFFGFAEAAGIPRADVNLLWSLVDTDNSGQVSIAEFKRWVLDLTGPNARERLRREE